MGSTEAIMVEMYSNELTTLDSCRSVCINQNKDDIFSAKEREIKQLYLEWIRMDYAIPEVTK
jgi:hypothetical protein